MNFRITGLPADPFKSLYGLSDDELSQRGVARYIVDKTPGFPDRIEMRDGEIGESMLLLNHEYQSADTPYKASHAIFVRENAMATYDQINEIPTVMKVRLLSLRAFDKVGMMLDADVVDGEDVETVIARMFTNESVDYIHVHMQNGAASQGELTVLENSDAFEMETCISRRCGDQQ